jgi:hypothetical protein
MFVYNNNTLKESFDLVNLTYRLTHTKSGMCIEIKFNPNAVAGEVNTNPYKVFKEVDGTYVIYKEFYPKNNNILQNFEDAILFFEDSIYQQLKETKPQVNQPQPQNTPPPKKVKIPPLVGDIVRVNGKHGIVTQVDGTKVLVRDLTKEEALRILKNKQNAEISLTTND